MKVLSIDVGIKNLAFCLFEKPTGSDSYQVTQWDIVNVSERDIVICGFSDKQKVECDKPAKFQKNGQCFCLKHSKKQQYKVPTSDLKSISKRKIQQFTEHLDGFGSQSNTLLMKKSRGTASTNENILVEE